MALEALLGPFVGLVELLKSFGERRIDRSRAGLTALSKALFETRIYLRDRENGAARDQAREDDIVRLWSGAAVELRDLDAQLAGLCQHKAEYWVQPDEWSAQTIRERGIGIDELFRRYREVLPVPGARFG